MFVYIDALIKAVGKDYKSVLKSLYDEKLIKSCRDLVEITMDKDKAIHLQSILHFYSADNVPALPKRLPKSRKEE